jgi:hypothetical protein
MAKVLAAIFMHLVEREFSPCAGRVRVRKKTGVQIVRRKQVAPVCGDVVEGELRVRGGAVKVRRRRLDRRPRGGAQGAARDVRAVPAVDVADVGVAEVALKQRVGSVGYQGDGDE